MSAYLFNSSHRYGYRHRKHHTSTLESSPASQTCSLPFSSVNLMAMHQHFSDVSYIQKQQTNKTLQNTLSHVFLSWLCSLGSAFKIRSNYFYFSSSSTSAFALVWDIITHFSSRPMPWPSDWAPSYSCPFTFHLKTSAWWCCSNPDETVALLCSKPCSGSPLPSQGEPNFLCYLVFCLHCAPAPPAALRGMFPPCDLRAHWQPPVRVLSAQMPSF